MRTKFILALILIGTSTLNGQAQEQKWQWVKQFGTNGNDYSCDLALDEASNAYIVGYTDNVYAKTEKTDNADICLIKTDPAGNLLWTRQITAGGSNQALAVVADSKGDMYFTGNTYGSFPGSTNNGSADLVVGKVSGDGQTVWIRELGTKESDYGIDLAMNNSGDIYVAGDTYGKLGNKYAGDADVFLAKYDGNGYTSWIKEFGTVGPDHCGAVICDSQENIYLVGDTSGALDKNNNQGDADVFLVKYDPYGEKIWSRQFGTKAGDYGCTITRDANDNIYIAGDTKGSFKGYANAGQTDIFMAKFDASGKMAWLKQFGTKENDHARKIIADQLGCVYLDGDTNSVFSGNTNKGKSDIFLAKLDASGNIIWIKQFGTSENDFCSGIGLNNNHELYISGDTQGNMGNMSTGGISDIFLLNINTTGPPQVEQPGEIIKGGAKGK